MKTVKYLIYSTELNAYYCVEGNRWRQSLLWAWPFSDDKAAKDFAKLKLSPCKGLKIIRVTETIEDFDLI